MRSRGWMAAALITASAAMSQPARAADDGYANVFSSLFTAVGVIKPDRPPEISYRERAPLVLPPQPGLPKPAEGGKRTADWPQDPDVVRRRKEAEEARAPRYAVGDHAQMLSAEDMAKGRGESQPFNPGTGCLGNGNSRNCLLVSPDALKAMGDRYSADNPSSSNTLEAGKEPDRIYLTQPPKGYLKATKTVKATNDGPRLAIDQSNPRAFLAPPKREEE